MAHGIDQRKNTRPIALVGETRLGAILVFGLAGAMAGAVAALVFGNSFLGVVAGYAVGGILAVILAALTLYLCGRYSGNGG